MKRVLLVAVGLMCCGPAAWAENLRLSDLAPLGATQLSKEELQALLPGAKVKSIASTTGSARYWENSPDGKFIASSDNRGGSSGRPLQAQGTWHIGDNGTYCVQLEWRTVTEQWCRILFKAGDKYYGVRSLSNPADVAHEYSITR